MEAPGISVVVPHYDDLPGLDRCLTALAAQTVDRAGFEVVVADNGTPAGEEAVMQVIAGRARLVPAPERGAGPARNAGVAAARGSLLAFTDADCVPEPEWLARGIAALDNHDLAGGRMVVLVGGGRKSGAAAFEQVFAFDNRDYVLRKGFTVTANLFCSRAVFDRVGPFRVGVSEDLDWCHRARALGYRIGYAAGAVVGHPARTDWRGLLVKWRRLNAESFGLAAETPRGRLGWLLRSWTLPASVVAHAPRVLFSPALRGPRERAAALATLARIRLWRFADAHRLLLRRR